MIIFMCKESYVQDVIVITNRKLVKGDYIGQLKKVAGRKPYAMILREKDLSDAEYEKTAEEVLKICDEAGVTCFIHSKTEIAKKLHCPNIHLSVTDLTADIRKDFQRISVSCHSMEDVKKAEQYGATQIVLGTIFETDCKKGLKGRGTGFVKEICAATELPVYAIGGISPENLSSVKEAGAEGGCMMSYMMTLR